MTWPWWIVLGFVLAQAERSIRTWWRERQRTRALAQACPRCGAPRSGLRGEYFCPACVLALLERM